MKQSDLIATTVVTAVVFFFAFVPGALDTFKYLSREHAFTMSFLKFGVLATFGECLALRFLAGVYNRPGFGVIPKFVVWGLLGMIIKAAFIVFATGAPNLAASLGLPITAQTLATGSFGVKIFAAFTVSASMNLVFGPWMMTLHKITDTHIHNTGGTLSGALTPIDMSGILKKMDWSVMWNFVFKKTIPFFWIPAHTITFMLPGEFQILFAAMLGIALGLILAYAASQKSNDSNHQPAVA